MRVNGADFFFFDIGKQAVLDALPDLGANAQGGAAQQVHGLGDGSIGAVFNGDDSVVGFPAFNRVKDVLEGGVGNEFNAFPEPGEGGLVAPCAFRAEVADPEPSFQQQPHAYDLAVDAHQPFFREFPGIVLQDFIHEVAFAFRHKEMGVGFFLDDTYFVDALHAPFDQVNNLCIDAVDLCSQFIKGHNVGGS